MSLKKCYLLGSHVTGAKVIDTFCTDKVIFVIINKETETKCEE